MNPPAFLGEPLMIALGWALMHFLWQGTGIALILAAANASLRKSSAGVRYGLACIAMVLMVMALAGTFVWFAFALPAAPAAASDKGTLFAGPEFVAAVGSSTRALQVKALLATCAPWLDCLWLAGVIVFSARSAGGWVAAQRLRWTETTPVDPIWEQRAKRLAQALSVSFPVRISKSALAQLPAVVGWLRPVILVPASAFVGVDPQQLEALLAHELAHIRRHDYLVNLIQTAAETLLFYHPAVWWVGRRIRIERENCCDDLAVSACGDVLTYARALARLEELRARTSKYAMAADGGVLIPRIRRLIASGRPAERGTKTWLAAVLALLTLGAAWVGAQVASSKQSQAGSPVTGPGAKPPAAVESKSFIDDLAGAGYANLTAEQLIAFKNQGVTAGYIRQMNSAGMADLAPDQLIALRIHGAEPERIREMRSAGFDHLTPDEVLAIQIHGVTPDFAAQMKGLGFGATTVDQLIALRIHGVTPEYADGIKALGLPGMTIDELIAFRIHGVEASQVQEFKSLGLRTPTADQIVALRIHDVTPEYVRGLKAAGLTNLSFDDAIAARIHGISAASVFEALKQGAKKVMMNVLNQLKQAGIVSPDRQ
ncbi:MAG: M56 family metallopeptidase [Acidobacteriia bacterium]|nr:M56 family metallopeptidase [Terriglobia bacterium]